MVSPFWFLASIAGALSPMFNVIVFKINPPVPQRGRCIVPPLGDRGILFYKCCFIHLFVILPIFYNQSKGMLTFGEGRVKAMPYMSVLGIVFHQHPLVIYIAMERLYT